MDVLAHDWPNLLLYAFPPIALIPQVIRRIREHKHKVNIVSPLWRNQHWFLRAAHHSPMAHFPETGPPLSGEQNDVASQARAVGSASLASRWELADLPESVQNTYT